MKLNVQRYGEYVAMFVIWLCLLLLFGFLSENFLTLDTLRSLANRIPTLTVIAAGMTLVLIVGGIDLSVGSVMGVSGAVLGVLIAGWDWPFWQAVPFALGVGLLAGFMNGLISVRLGIPSFIVTLGMLEVARGLSYLVTNSQTKYIGSAVEALARPLSGLGLSPAFLLAAAVVVLLQVLLSQTIFGRYLVAIGTNEQAVRLAGINPRPIKIAVFALLGFLTGLGAIFYTSRLGSADPNAGVGLELSAIAAVVIGGTSLFGGRGRLPNTVIGTLIIGVLFNALVLLNVTYPVQQMIIGGIIIAAVWLDTLLQRLR